MARDIDLDVVFTDHNVDWIAIVLVADFDSLPTQQRDRYAKDVARPGTFRGAFPSSHFRNSLSGGLSLNALSTCPLADERQFDWASIRQLTQPFRTQTP